MQSTGLLFLSRTRPHAATASDGTFSLLIYALDRIAPHQVESWVLLWPGEAARQFWAENGERLTAGTAIEATTERIRAHATSNRTPEIHATAIQIEIAPDRRNKATTHETETAT